ncbi:hypothetical protein LOCC1_G005831 [Lachnellula occidentalis]|uniref:Uncharacterized protein n=1 Tax=Lachnellula occidentalis TaxID=215460 RepID=A0A8H8UCE8_9HELO|nr:hypothetical protein LOCC1_G005831 [Lachnellula occidentalis]
MTSNNVSSGNPARKSILTISLSQHLIGSPIEKAIEADWAKEKAYGIIHSFVNVGFNLDPTDVLGALKALKYELGERTWDGIIIGWCIRGNVEFTLLFEQVHSACCEVAPRAKIMFSTGSDNLVETVVRNFPMKIIA